MRRRPALIVVAALVGVSAVPAAEARGARLVVSGAGFGHGVGMSQYGASGFAQRGVGYRAILRHYYRGTELRRLDGERRVRVILQANDPVVRFRGATRAGRRGLSPAVSYRMERTGNRLRLESGSGRRLAVFSGPVRVEGSGPLRLLGPALNGVSNGRYRGALEIRPGVNGGVNAINLVELEAYLRGVVPAESPALWPAEALRAQAVAARTFAITTDAGGVGFDHWPDARSQVYRGTSVEHPRTDAAIRATAGEVVTYRGRPVITYFFSTSGGRTEDVENVFGGAASPWLRSVPDPYDSVSPLHRWTRSFDLGRARALLGDAVRGSLRGIRVLRRGSSPRVITAEVIGTRGRTRVSGQRIQFRLGLPDSWMTFRVVR